MDLELSSKARAHARRVGAPWLEGAVLELEPGPHLFLDWRFVLPGELGLIGSYWGTEAEDPIPLRLWNNDEWKDRPVEAHYVPRDVPQGIRIVAQMAEKSEPFAEGEAPGSRIIHHEGVYRTWYRHRASENMGVLHYAESPDAYAWGEAVKCSFDWSACPEADGHERPEVFVDP